MTERVLPTLPGLRPEIGPWRCCRIDARIGHAVSHRQAFELRGAVPLSPRPVFPRHLGR